MQKQKPSAPAAVRDAQAILAVLRAELVSAKTVLEIGSGTGQHAVTFAAALGHLSWQTSDLDDNHPGIRAWLEDAGLSNLLELLSLDVVTAECPAQFYGAVFSANTAHIMSFAAIEKMFALVCAVLNDGGRFCLYGPFREDGQFNTSSNAAFHESLQQGNADMGIRDLEALDRMAVDGGLGRVRRYAMPANNLLVVWQKNRGAGNDNT